MFHDTPTYDASNTMFSPKGRLFQVEYAREAVKRGETSLGVKYSDGALIIARRKKKKHRSITNSSNKLFKIAPNIIGSSSGLTADGRVLIDFCRNIARREDILYGESISIPRLVKRLGNVLGSYTQHGGVRPFGTTLQIGGLDTEGIHMYETDISGAITDHKASVIGRDKLLCLEKLEISYQFKNSHQETLEMCRDIFNSLKDADDPNITYEVMFTDREKGFEHFFIRDQDSF